MGHFISYVQALRGMIPERLYNFIAEFFKLTDVFMPSNVFE
jgi:hypothetical protein